MNDYSMYKVLLEGLCVLLDSFEEQGAKPEGIEASLRDFFKLELHTYLMYLSASDGVLSTEERNFMNYMFDVDMSSKDYAKFINDNNIYSYEFEKRLPLVLQIVARHEVKLKLLAASRGVNFEEPVVTQFCDFYLEIGKAFIQCDGVEDNEVTEMKNYIDNMYSNMMSYLKNITGQDDDDDVVFLGKKQ